MAANYYYTKNNQTFGPFTPTQFQQLADSGLLKPTDMVWREGTEQWVRASSIANLFGGRPQSALPPPRPPVANVAVIVPAQTELNDPALEWPPRYQPEEFERMYARILGLSIPVTVAGVFISFIPVAGLLSAMSAAILLAIVTNWMLYKAWSQIQDGGPRTTPGRAVGFRFIPFFTFYWEFIAIKGLAVDINRYTRQHGIRAGVVSAQLATWYCILNIVSGTLGALPLVGWPFRLPAIVLGLIVMHQLKIASMAIAKARMPATAPQPGAHKVTTPHGRFDALEVVADGLKAAEKFVSLALRDPEQSSYANE